MRACTAAQVVTYYKSLTGDVPVNVVENLKCAIGHSHFSQSNCRDSKDLLYTEMPVSCESWLQFANSVAIEVHVRSHSFCQSTPVLATYDSWETSMGGCATGVQASSVDDDA